jgi:putative transposase
MPLPRYRRSILDREEVVAAVKELIEIRVAELDCTLIALEVMPDHVLLSLCAPPRYAPAGLAGKIKGGTGSALAARFPELKRQGHIWSRSYFMLHRRHGPHRSRPPVHINPNGAG